MGQRLSGTLRGGQKERAGEVQRWRDKGGELRQPQVGGGLKAEADAFYLLINRSAPPTDRGVPLPRPSTPIFFSSVERPDSPASLSYLTSHPSNLCFFSVADEAAAAAVSLLSIFTRAPPPEASITPS